MSETPAGLLKMREKFPPHQISQLPKGGRMLDFVGHAALTDRLLDADPTWTWEPLAMSPEGLPVLDPLGGMWIRLTVCGVTRLGYGHAGDKIGGDAIKEVIGDALRNAAMRFGAALELWHKGELHVEARERYVMPESELIDWRTAIAAAPTVGELKRLVAEATVACKDDAEALASVQAAAAAKAAKARKAVAA